MWRAKAKAFWVKEILGGSKTGLGGRGFSHRRLLICGGRLKVWSVSELGRASGTRGTCRTRLPERVHIKEWWLELS